MVRQHFSQKNLSVKVDKGCKCFKPIIKRSLYFINHKCRERTMDEKNILPLIQRHIKSRVSKVEELSAVVFFFSFTSAI